MFRAKALLTNLSVNLADSYFNSMTSFSDDALRALLAPGMRDPQTPRFRFRDRFRPVMHLSPLQQMQAVDLDTYLPGDILTKVDRATMAHSLESRAPWLDHRVAEMSFQMSSIQHIRGTERKSFFKRCVGPLLPPAILHRRKMGFSVPLAEWLRTSLKPLFESTVLAGGGEQFFRDHEVKRIWSEHQGGYHNHERKLWNILMLACWDAKHTTGRLTAQKETTV